MGVFLCEALQLRGQLHTPLWYDCVCIKRYLKEVSATEQPSHGATHNGDAAPRAQNQWCSLRLQQHQGDIMISEKPKKKYFKPKKRVDKMTEEELEEFAKFIFDNLIGDIQDKGEPNHKSE